MSLSEVYDRAIQDAERARILRVLTLRAMLAQGESQREMAERFGLTQPAISYQVAAARTEGVRPSELIAAGATLLKHVVETAGFSRLAVFGSAARGDDRSDSDVDFLVQPPEAADAFAVSRLEVTLAAILGRNVDVLSYRGLDPLMDQDILRDRLLL